MGDSDPQYVHDECRGFWKWSLKTVAENGVDLSQPPQRCCRDLAGECTVALVERRQRRCPPGAVQTCGKAVIERRAVTQNRGYEADGALPRRQAGNLSCFFCRG